MRQPPQHFVLLKTLRLRAPAYDPVNGTLYSVYATLTIAPDFEPTHLNDTVAGREKQPFVSVESLCGGEDEVEILYLLLRMGTGRNTQKTVSRRKLGTLTASRKDCNAA